MRRGRRVGALIALLGICTVPPSCADFASVASNLCGNSVIDASEDCDTHPTEPGTECAAAGTPNACRFVCSGPETTGAVCPIGWGCGQDGICRWPSGRFAPLDDFVPFASPHDLSVVDFNGDGVPDVLLLGDDDAVGLTPVRIVFTANGSTPREVLALPTNVAATAVGDVNHDGTSELAFANLDGVSLFDGRADNRSPFSPYPMLVPPAGTLLRVVPMDVIAAEPGDEIVLLTNRKKEGAVLVRPEGKLPEAVLTLLPGAEKDLAWPIVWGPLDEGAPCHQIVIPYRGASEVLHFTPCRVAGGSVEWNVGGSLQSIALPPGARLDRGVLLVDLDLDQHLDLLVGASEHAFVAWGIGDGTFSSAKSNGELGKAGPYALPAEAGGDTAFPLAAADLNADGIIDFVVPGGIVISGPSGYVTTQINAGSPWTQAVIADLNADGLPDVAAGSSVAIDIEFFGNAGGGVFNPASVATDGPTDNFVVGDFDGDLVTDLAFAQNLDHSGVRQDAPSIAFGAAKGPPSGPVIVAALGEVEQLASARFPSVTGTDGIADLVAVSRDLTQATDLMFAFRGEGSRSLRASLPLGGSTDPALAVAMAIGRFGDSTPDLAALGASPTTGALRLWCIEGTEQIDFTHLLPSPPLSPLFHSNAPGSTVSFRYNAYLAAGDLTGDGVAEVVLVAPYGPAADGAALVIADYNAASSTFLPRAEQPFSAALSIDSTLRLLDVDGDGHLDALITTGNDENPSDLVVLWGDASGGIDTTSPGRAQIRGGVSDVACLPRPGRGCDLALVSVAGTFRGQVKSDRSFTIAPLTDLPGGRGIGVGDFDRDGLQDLAIQTDGGLQLYRSLPVRQ
ncbi:MAG: VCBS repeat-containing protein [Byssovorax sp.]